jgi:hypothetical protein
MLRCQSIRALSTYTVNNNCGIRSLSSLQGLVQTKIEDCGTVATLILNRPPVNSLSLEM